MAERVPYPHKLLPTLYLAARFYAAFMLLSYGFAKVMGAQFTVLDSQLAKPLGDVSGFWLTWYYFGYSAFYSALVAWTQILGAVLLCFRRTTLVGALVLFPVMVNIVGIDVWVVRFPLDSGALRNAIFVLLAVTVVLCFHAKDLYRSLLQKRNDLALWGKPRVWIVGTQIAVVVGMILYTARDGYWLANVNNRAPTPIDGAWHVVERHPARIDLPEWIYFEYNRAYMVVFRFSDGKTETHDFRVDEQTNELNISNEWLTAGTDIFHGSWKRSGDAMTVSGTWAGNQPVELTMQRKQMPVKDHQ